jgi:two-component system, OmpR family, sensor histidine kinase CiaH
MFRSARLKLTLFYLAALLIFSLASTNIVRLLAENQYGQSDAAQRGEVERLFYHGFGFSGLPPGSNMFKYNSVQQEQTVMAKEQLARELIWINVGALVIGGLFSYWFAGRTLHPIEEAHKAQTRFASDASHELRTPLTNMKVENEVFLRQKHFSETEARELITSNLEEVERLENLSTSLLDLTRYSQTPLKLMPLAAVPLVSEAILRVGKRAKAKRVTITKQLPEAHVEGHHDSLLQLIGIVLDNAIKYGPEGGTVAVQGRTDSGHYVVSITDQGPGIAPSDLPHIFERLYRGDKARSSKVSGYGLGLALARKIAEANHITITVRNNKGGGARFELNLNVAK